jgi:hypothetical protein
MYCRRLALAILLANTCIGCVTARPQASTEGRMIPERRLLQFGRYEYVCEPMTAREPKEIEALLDQYGRHGWQVVGFTERGGNTTGFCAVR